MQIYTHGDPGHYSRKDHHFDHGRVHKKVDKSCSTLSSGKLIPPQKSKEDVLKDRRVHRRKKIESRLLRRIEKRDEQCKSFALLILGDAISKDSCVYEFSQRKSRPSPTLWLIVSDPIDSTLLESSSLTSLLKQLNCPKEVFPTVSETLQGISKTANEALIRVSKLESELKIVRVLFQMSVFTQSAEKLLSEDRKEGFFLDLQLVEQWERL